MKYPDYCVVNEKRKEDLVVIEKDSLLESKIDYCAKIENPEIPKYSLLWVHEHGDLEFKSFALSNLYDWKIVRESPDYILLVPTKKKN